MVRVSLVDYAFWNNIGFLEYPPLVAFADFSCAAINVVVDIMLVLMESRRREFFYLNSPGWPKATSSWMA